VNVAAEVTANIDWQNAIGRSIVYAFLSRGLAYPEPAQLGMLRERILPGVVDLELDGPVGEAIEGAIPALQASSDTLRAAHTAIFSLTVSADCPDYETAYLSRDIFQQTQVMADVAGFYRAHGLEVGAQRIQRPDHITTELEYMGFLARKEAYAIEHLGPEQQEMAREAQQLFLRDHLACWAPSLGRRIAARDDNPYSPYGRLGSALAAWVEADTEWLGVTPARTVDGPTLEWPEPDDGTCGAEAECPAMAQVPLATELINPV
jgi:DMSO reductase family type II enzyme chaperone